MLNFYKNYVEDLAPLAAMRRMRQLYFGQNPLSDIAPLFAMPELIDCSMDGTRVPPPVRASL